MFINKIKYKNIGKKDREEENALYLEQKEEIE
jgi:hypothetical protein